MDYRTLFLFDIISLAIYTGALLILALNNRRITGMSWFALSALLDLTKAVLQSLRGTLPQAITLFAADQIVLLSVFAMYMGFRWFLYRKPIRRPMLLFASAFSVYILLCVTRSSHFVVITTPPGLAIFIFTTILLLRFGKDSFRAASRTAAGLLLLRIGFDLYRAGFIVFVYGDAPDRRHLSDPRWLTVMFAIMLGEATMVLIYVWFFVVESNRDLRESALTDSLTGVMNRRAFARESLREIARSRRSSTPLCVIAIDIDFFKAVNDRHGHHAGDQALCHFATLLTAELRQTDLIARLGGEEFAVLLPDTPLLSAARVAEKLRHLLASRPLTLPDSAVAMTFTAGVAQLLASDTTFEAMLSRADRALYRGKSDGRNRIAIAEPHRLPPTGLHLLTPEEHQLLA